MFSKLVKISLLSFMLLGCVSNQPVVNTTQLAEIDTELAVLNLQQHQPEEAKAHLLEAQNLAPHDALVLVGEGFYDLNAHEVPEAAAFYHQAIHLAPQDPKIQNDYGVFLYQTHQFALALPYFLKAAYDPDNLCAAEAFQNAALTELKLGDHAAAERYFKAAEWFHG